MSTKRLIHELMSSPWMISPDQAQHYMPQLHQLLTGNVVGYHDESDRRSEDRGKRYNNEPMMISAGQLVTADWRNGFATAQKDSVAVIPISGPIMKYDNCGDAGTLTMTNWVKDAASNPNIKGIILSIDSPGGTVSGTQTLADAISAAKMQKPVISFVQDGMMASAAYWIGSSANEIVASHATSQIGSIGVYTTLVDATGFYEQKGYKVEDIYSTLSTEKNADYRAWKDTGKAPKDLVSGLDHIAQTFIDVVNTNRDGKINVKNGDPFKGKVFNANDALKNGLIDSIGGMDSVVSRIEELAKKSPTSSSNTDMKITFKSTWAALGAVLGISAVREMTEEDFDKANADIAAKNDTITQLTSERDAATASLATEKQARETAEARIVELEGTIATYGKKPGAEPTAPTKESDKISEDESNAVIENLPHNKAAANNPFIND